MPYGVVYIYYLLKSVENNGIIMPAAYSANRRLWRRKMANFIIKNVSEDLIDMELDRCISSIEGMCTCERCRADVKAFALNHFPPHYVVTDMGEALVRASMLSNQFEADIITAIMSAVMVVKSKPRHG